jgi:GntR family transcriptional regulator/MocR family aminotransferase
MVTKDEPVAPAASPTDPGAGGVSGGAPELPVLGAAPELSLSVERRRGAPIHEQLEQALREEIRSGRLRPGTRLPSSRALAGQLAISRGVVVEAYAQLTAEGYLISAQGAPTRVAPSASAERPPVPATSLEPRRLYDFAPDLPDLTAFPRQQWLRSARSVLRQAPFAALGHGDPRGAPELRNELMAYLGRARSAAPEPEHTAICAGFAHGFAALCRVLRARGLERIAVEEPGARLHRLVASAAGLEPVPTRVDELGISVPELAQTGCEVVVLTPSHQYPTGGVLGPERRAALLEWAEEEDALLVEDDYDAELRHDRGPVGALQGLAPERVCQIGSLSLRLAPALRIGWILSPSWLTGALTYELGLAGGAPPVLDQLALSDFIARGELDRHLRRMRGRYRDRRNALLAVLAEELPEARVQGIAAGTFLLASLDGEPDLGAVVRAAAARGVEVQPADSSRPGLVLGYGNLAEPAIERGIRLLSQAAAEARAAADGGPRAAEGGPRAAAEGGPRG